MFETQLFIGVSSAPERERTADAPRPRLPAVCLSQAHIACDITSLLVIILKWDRLLLAKFLPSGRNPNRFRHFLFENLVHPLYLSVFDELFFQPPMSVRRSESRLEEREGGRLAGVDKEGRKLQGLPETESGKMRNRTLPVIIPHRVQKVKQDSNGSIDPRRQG